VCAPYEVVKQPSAVKEREMKKTIVIILTALALVGCRMVDRDAGIDDDGVTDEPNTEKPSDSGIIYTKEFWGEWVHMDTGDKWYISDNTITVNGAEASTSATLSKHSERVLEVTDGGRQYYLYASRIANASFTGTIVGDAGAAGSIRAASRGSKVTGKNQKNKANESSAVTDEDGKFTLEGIILGDPYEVTPEGGSPVTITPRSDGGDIGVITVTTGVNFKTSLIPTQSSTDMTELYMNEVYHFEIEFENVGDKDCPSPAYTVTEPSGVTITGVLQGILGTIEPGVKKSVPISVLCSAVADDYEYKKISIRIADGAGKTWEDSVSLRFYKETMSFNIKAEKPISGIAISPDSKTYSFTNIINGTVVAPRRVSGNYLVVFSGATLETETRYSLGIGVEADGDFSAFLEPGRYEPNNTEDEAVSLSEQKIMAYLYKNDIDYYRVFYGSFRLPPAPTNASASAADAQVTVSWAAVSEAESYNVYRSTSQTGAYTKVGASTTTSYVDTVAAAGTYYYKASAVNADGFESAPSTPTTVAVAGPPTPTNVSASAADNKVTVSWTVVTEAKSYNIYRSDSQTGTYTKVGAPTTASYVDTVTRAGTYYYKASAVSMGGLESALSTPTAIAAGPAVPTNVSASAADAQVTVSWTEVTGASSYNVYRSDSQTGTYTKIGASTTTSYVDTVTRAGTYYYKASTVSMGGLESALSTPTAIAALTREIDVTDLFETLSWLSANAVNSTQYTLLLGKDETISAQPLSYSGKTDITIILKGKGRERIVSLSGNGSLFTVESGVTLVLDDRITLKGHSSNTASLVRVNSGGNLVLKDGAKISGNTASFYGGGVYIYGGTFTLSGGEISGNSAVASNGNISYGGGVYVYSGTFSMSGGEISGNTSSASVFASSGGGVYMNSGTFTLSGGEISGNIVISIQSASSGYGYYSRGGGVAMDGGTFTMSGGEISGNTSSGVSIGGGVYIYGGMFTMSGGEISGNTATSAATGFPAAAYGGGVSVQGGKFTMSGGTISNNTAIPFSASAYGGGVYESGTGKFTKQSGGTIYGSNGGSLRNSATNGQAVFIALGNSVSYQRNTTAGVGATLDSTKSGAAGGWE
jgi:fibronectin type 3 domain-containing protein